jgi:RNA methyltransferase, TrmH family
LVASNVNRGRITSTANTRLKAAARLRGRRERDRQGMTLIDGVRETTRALAGGARLRETFVSPELCVDDECQQLLGSLREAAVPVLELSREAFGRLAYGDRKEGIVAVAETPVRGLADLDLPDNPLIAVVEAVEKPGNLGAILRTADAVALDALVLADTTTDLFNPNVIRASIGTVFSVPLATAATPDVLTWLIGRGMRVIAASLDGDIEYTAADYSGGVAIALGSEAYGLSAAWVEQADASVRIPMLGVADSLNVSSTAAVLFYEALRQRRAG